MGLINRLLPVFIAILLLARPTPVHAAAEADDEVVFGGEYVVGEEDVLDGDLIVIGGEVDIREGGRVDGSVIMIGGTVTIDGEVDGDVRQLGGTLELEDDARIDGDIVTNGGSLIRADGSRVSGEVRTEDGDEKPQADSRGPWGIGRFILDGFWNLLMLGAMAGLSVLVGILWPGQLAVMGEGVTKNPVLAGGVGLLTVGVVVPVLVVSVLTLILIPVSLAGFATLGAAGALGWIALSYETGRRIGELAGQDWAPGLAAGVGALLVGIVFIGIERIPCVGWAMQAAIGMVGLGAVMLTRFGTREYPES